MTVREAIEELRAAAERTPLGLDVELRISLCDGSGIDESTELEIDHFARVSRESGGVHSWYVGVKGHPHRDQEQGRTTRMPGVANEAEDYLKKWTEEQG